MTEKQTSRGVKYEGFGTERTAAEWARVAGIPRNSFGRYLAAGWTVEEIFQYRRIKYDPQAEESEWMKRVGPKMTETINLIMELLENSGYKPSANAIKIVNLPNHIHKIDYRKQYLGYYDYTADVLHLRDGNRLALKTPVVAKPKIRLSPTGEWWLHPDTKRALLDNLLKKHIV